MAAAAAPNPVVAAIEGVGAMLKKMFGAQAESESLSAPEASRPASAEAGPPAPNARAASAPEATQSAAPMLEPAQAGSDGDDPVSRILRDVGAAL